MRGSGGPGSSFPYFLLPSPRYTLAGSSLSRNKTYVHLLLKHIYPATGVGPNFLTCRYASEKIFLSRKRSAAEMRESGHRG